MGDTFFWIALGVVLAVVLAILIIRRVRRGIHAVQGAAKAESYRPSRDRVRVGKRPVPAVPKKTVKPKPVFRGPLGPALIAFGFDDPAGFITLFTCQPMRTGSLGAFTPITGALPDIRIPFAWQLGAASGIGDRGKNSDRAYFEFAYPPEATPEQGNDVLAKHASDPVTQIFWDKNGKMIRKSALPPEDSCQMTDAIPKVKSVLFTNRLLPALRRVCLEESTRFKGLIEASPDVPPEWREKASRLEAFAKQGEMPPEEKLRALMDGEKSLPPKFRLPLLRVAVPFLIAAGIPWSEAVTLLSRIADDESGANGAPAKHLSTFLTRVAAFNGHLPRFGAEVDETGRVTQLFCYEEKDLTGAPPAAARSSLK